MAKLRVANIHKELSPESLKRLHELRSRQIRISLKRLSFKSGLPKSRSVKLLFNYKKAEELLIKRPKEVHPAAKLVPLITRISSSMVKGLPLIESNNNTDEPVALLDSSKVHSPFGPARQQHKVPQNKNMFDFLKDQKLELKFGVDTPANAADSNYAPMAAFSTRSLEPATNGTPVMQPKDDFITKVHGKPHSSSQFVQPGGDSRSSEVLLSLGLQPRTNSPSPSSSQANGTDTEMTPELYKNSSYKKLSSVDFTSPLGQYILSLGAVDGSSRNMNAEAMCTRNKRKRSSSVTDGFPITYQGPKNKADKKRDHHQYCFNKKQQEIRQFTINKGLSPNSYTKFLELRSKQIRITLNKLQFELEKTTCKGTEDISIKRSRGVNRVARLVPMVTRLSSSFLQGFSLKNTQD